MSVAALSGAVVATATSMYWTPSLAGVPTLSLNLQPLQPSERRSSNFLQVVGPVVDCFHCASLRMVLLASNPGCCSDQEIAVACGSWQCAAIPIRAYQNGSSTSPWCLTAQPICWHFVATTTAFASGKSCCTCNACDNVLVDVERGRTAAGACMYGLRHAIICSVVVGAASRSSRTSVPLFGFFVPMGRSTRALSAGTAGSI